MTFSIKCVDAEEAEFLHDALGLWIDDMDKNIEGLREMSDTSWKAMMTRKGVLLPKGFGRDGHIGQIEEDRGRARRLQKIIDNAPSCD